MLVRFLRRKGDIISMLTSLGVQGILSSGFMRQSHRRLSTYIVCVPILFTAIASLLMIDIIDVLTSHETLWLYTAHVDSYGYRFRIITCVPYCRTWYYGPGRSFEIDVLFLAFMVEC
jgi:hypothetical protein